MASLTQWTWVWVDSGSQWWTGRPGMLQFMGSQRVGTTEQLNWTELNILFSKWMVIQSQYLINSFRAYFKHRVLFVWHVDKKCTWLSVFVSTLKQNFQSFFKSPNHLNGSTTWDCKTRLETKCWYHLQILFTQDFLKSVQQKWTKFWGWYETATMICNF